MSVKRINFAHYYSQIMHKMIRKRLFLAFVLLFMVANAFAENRQHLVKPGDTLYSISKKYGVTVEAIQAANPSIEGTNIPSGMVLVIPGEEVEDQKEGKKKAILFNFKKKDKESKKAEKAQPAQPEQKPVEAKPEEKKEEAPVVQARQKQFGAPDNIAVIMPFNLNAQTSNDEKQQMRSVEFYEGFLLAVNEAQQAGQKILVQTYDLGTKSMNEILATKSLLDADFVIAPMDAPDVKQVADFGKANEINVVSPFLFNQEMGRANKNLIQLNTSKTMLYDNLTSDVIKRFEGYDIVFLSDSNYVSKKDPYVKYLKDELKSRNVKYYDFSYLNPERLTSVDSTLNIVNHDILYIPEANSKESMKKMFPCLKCTTFDLASEQPKTGKTAVLGYPEWILYTADFMDYYYDMNVYIFSKFYINPFDENVKTFNNSFRYWYAKEPMALTPRYANLGYDIGKYFLAAVRKHGRNFDNHLADFTKETLQSMMSFKRDDEGYINKGLYLVHFTPASQIEKYEIK